MKSTFDILGNITDIETIAVSSKIRELKTLQSRFGRGCWRKLKSIASVSLANDTVRLAEVHWYEAHGIGRVRMKIKRFLD